MKKTKSDILRTKTVCVANTSRILHSYTAYRIDGMDLVLVFLDSRIHDTLTLIHVKDPAYWLKGLRLQIHTTKYLLNIYLRRKPF